VKKILYLITKSNWGGAQRYVYDLASAFTKKGYDMSVACGGNGLLVKKLKTENIPVIPIKSFQRDINFFKEFKSFFELLRVFNQMRPDVVHLNSSKAGGLGALAARISGVPNIIFTAHGWPFGEKRNIFSKILIWKLSWITALLSHHVICVSNYDLRIAQQMPFIKKKVVRVYNGIAPMTFSDGTAVRQNFPKGVHITGTVGELTKNKNQIALIEAAREDKNMYVALVGDGENRRYLKSKISEYGLTQRVKLFGFWDVRTVLRGFDTFVLPSLKEGLPYVLLEAKMAGLPIEANHVGGVPEILDAKDMSEFTLERMVEQTETLYHLHS